jgi:hypothetical protein
MQARPRESDRRREMSGELQFYGVTGAAHVIEAAIFAAMVAMMKWRLSAVKIDNPLAIKMAHDDAPVR